MTLTSRCETREGNVRKLKSSKLVKNDTSFSNLPGRYVQLFLVLKSGMRVLLPSLSKTEAYVTFQAEARLAAKRAARAEARDIRMRELERQQREVTEAALAGAYVLHV